ncbi:MAG: hypothetical protein J6Q61_06430 [Bacteroidales bacterium]|nr:hypothetical protein [Bacteroidales bacterium]
MIENIEVGAKYKGNVNGAIIQVTKIENGWVHYIDCKSGKPFMYGLDAFKRSLMTLLDNN